MVLCCFRCFVSLCRCGVIYAVKKGVLMWRPHPFLQRYKEHFRYNPQSSYALHILNNIHEYGSINDTVTLLKHITKPTLLIPSEQLYIHSYHYHRRLVPDHHIGQHNPLYQIMHDIHLKSLPKNQHVN